MIYLLFLWDIMKILTPEQIISQVKILTGDQFDSHLAKRLNVDKQSFPQYKKKHIVDLQQKIICLLLEKINDDNTST